MSWRGLLVGCHPPRHGFRQHFGDLRGQASVFGLGDFAQLAGKGRVGVDADLRAVFFHRRAR